MDKLSIAFLTILFLNGGSFLIWIGLLLALLTNMLPLNYKTLFSVTSFTTYYFYGFSGIFYTFFCTLSLLVCGAMYWLELSVDDIKNKIKELNVNEKPSTEVDNTLSPNGQLNQMEQYVDTFSQYRIKYVNMFCEKTGLDSTRIGSINSFYTYVSVMFDKFCQMFYGLMCRFRALTQNMKGFKTLYNGYDTLYQCKTNIDKLKALNIESQNKSNDLSLLQKTNLSPKNVDAKNLMDLCNFPELNLDQDSLNQEMADAQAKFDKMSPDEKKKEAESMMNMMKNMFDSFDNMKSMMEELTPTK